MGVEPPYLYQRPTASSFSSPSERAFNPKATTQATWTPKHARPKHEGPLISSKELNRHPDSYMIVPYGNLDWKPMNPNTKTKVKWIRLFQLLLRICSLIGAAGLLMCVICIRPTGDSLDWIIRIPPGIAILHCVYAVYHLSRSAKGRTPGSSASYMIFASIMDAGLIPFLAFTAIMAHNQYVETPNTDGHWTTLFGTDDQNTKIILSTYLISIATGGLHIVALCISIYLALLFRKISKMPPDMNPLEDTLTSRRSRHKKNKSSVSVATSESLSNRDSHLSAPLIDPPRTVPFMHTRNDSASSLTSTSPRRPPPSNRDSRSDLPSQFYNQAPSNQSSRADLRRSPDRSSKRSSALINSTPSPKRPISIQQQSLLQEPASENWFSHPGASPSPPNDSLPPPEFRHLRNSNSPSTSPPQKSNKYDFTNRSPRPLEMNPPTPPVAIAWRHGQHNGALQPASGNGSPATWDELNFKPAKSSLGYADDGYGIAGKSRFYGNLRGTVGTKSRVVSSGVDEETLRGGLRGREVSGKVAEEGRAY